MCDEFEVLKSIELILQCFVHKRAQAAEWEASASGAEDLGFESPFGYDVMGAFALLCWYFVD
jgi:hypothetical protein